MEYCLLKHNQFSLKKNKTKQENQNIYWRCSLFFWIKILPKKIFQAQSRKQDTRELPQTHRREISPNLHCLYHTFPDSHWQKLINSVISKQLKLKLEQLINNQLIYNRRAKNIQ